MFTKENIKKLPEFQNVAVERPDLSSIDVMSDPADILQDDSLLQQIFQFDTKTGLPVSDLDVLDNPSLKPELRDYMLRCLKRLPSVNNPDCLSDEDLVNLHFNRFEKGFDYVERLQKMVLPSEPSHE